MSKARQTAIGMIKYREGNSNLAKGDAQQRYENCEEGMEMFWELVIMWINIERSDYDF